jgi:hypothetical protein
LKNRANHHSQEFPHNSEKATMSTAVRHRSKVPKGGNGSHLDVPTGGPDAASSASSLPNEDDDGKGHDSSSPLVLVSNVVSRRHAIYYIPILMFFYIVGPTAIHIPKALYIWASKGFVTEFLLGPGLRDLVGSMVDDPHQLMVGDVTPPTPLAAYKDIILQEYEDYRATHALPILSEMDPEEQGPLDTKGVWKTLFLRAMGRETCAAPYFPKTMEAVRNSGLTAYSIMFSRLAPGQKIEPHTGFSKIIQIYHLALKVPPGEPRPYLSVKECDDEEETINCRSETYQWTEGREFIFDDSFTHHAENPNTSERIVLFLHIKRVDFKGWRESLIAGIMCYLFTWVPFESATLLVRGTEKTCALQPSGVKL